MGTVLRGSGLGILFIVAAALGAGPAPSSTGGTSGSATATRPAATRPTPADLKGLLSDLDADQWGTRQRAAERIMLQGEAARTELEQRLKGPISDELKQQIEIILAKLNESRQYGPTLVTLEVHDLPARQALTQLAGKAGVSFAPDALWAGGEEPHVTLNCDHEPFWSCLQQICAQAKIHLVKSDPNAPVQLARDDAKSLAAPYAVAGPYLFKIRQIEVTHSIDYGGGPNPNSAPPGRIFLSAWGEPKLTPGNWSVNQVSDLVVDKAARDPQAHSFDFGTMVGSSYPASITFRAGLRGNRMNLLRVQVQVTISGKKEKFEVKNALTARKVQRVIDGYGVEFVEAVRLGEGLYSYSVRVTRQAHSTAEFNAYRQALSRLMPRLLDAEGRMLQPSGGTTRSDMNTYSFTYEARTNAAAGKKVGEPTTFSWEIPSELKMIPLTVEFKDLPLPQ